MRVCDFLGIEFEDAMLDPTTYIDYGSYRKLSAENISSTALNEWSKNISIPTFKGSRYAWKDHPYFDFSFTPHHIAQSLKALGFDTQRPSLDDMMAALSRKHNAVASRFHKAEQSIVEQANRVRALEQTIAEQANHIRVVEAQLERFRNTIAGKCISGMSRLYSFIRRKQTLQ